MPNNAISQKLPLQETSSTPLIIFVALLWTPLQHINIFIVPSIPYLDAELQMGSHEDISFMPQQQHVLGHPCVTA